MAALSRLGRPRAAAGFALACARAAARACAARPSRGRQRRPCRAAGARAPTVQRQTSARRRSHRPTGTSSKTVGARAPAGLQAGADGRATAAPHTPEPPLVHTRARTRRRRAVAPAVTASAMAVAAQGRPPADSILFVLSFRFAGSAPLPRDGVARAAESGPGSHSRATERRGATEGRVAPKRGGYSRSWLECIAPSCAHSHVCKEHVFYSAVAFAKRGRALGCAVGRPR
jgi:hypothetical protein